MRSKLDGLIESGGDIYGLTYGDQTIDTLSGTRGLRLEYAMPMDWGMLKPRARLEYTTISRDRAMSVSAISTSTRSPATT
ncbi:autotransporter domain-containing protein [Pseudaminobacter salicylatoxidans]|uniref:autotransporter domain-containing protein n=1 Tax=Pseudaminobacter salicylatoxidans TaxID=93369 RepID=UPI000474C6B6